MPLTYPFFLVNVAQVLMRHFRQQYTDFNVLI